MANLENKRIKDTYEGLIKTNDNNAISSEVVLTDGAGNSTGVSVSTDGRVVASGTISFGSLKDTGENITITKFVDQADGIASNNNDTTIPTTAAVKSYVDSTELNDVTSVNSQTGAVVLDTDNIAEGSSNLYYTESRVSANSSVAANTAKNSYPSADATKVGHITITQAVDLDTLESNVATNNAKTGITAQQASDITTNNAKVGITTSQANAITANTAKVGITTDQANAIIANTAKNSYPSGDATKVGHLTVTQAVDLDTMESNIATNNAKVGITTSQANAITANTAKNSYPSGDATKVGHISVTQAVDLDTMESNIATNNAKISFDSTSSTKLAGIEEGADVTDAANVTAAGALMDSEVDADIKTLSLPANTTISTFAKTILDDADASAVRTTIGAGTSNLALGTSSTTALAGDTTTISSDQASAITANTAKNSYPSADSTKVGFISVTQAVDLDTMESNIATNNAKNTYPSADATKVGFISVTQAVDLDTLESNVATNNAKVGITTQQASDISTNNAKISFDSTSSTKLGTIEENADVTDTANVTAAGALMDSEVDANIKTLSLPASTTISTFAKTFLDDADAAAVRTTIGAGTSSTTGTVTEVTVGTGLDVSNGTTTPALSLDLSDFTDMTADMEATDEFIVLDSSSERRKAVNEIKSTLFSNNDLYKVIGLATDHSSRVLSDSGTSEGATSIMQNFEILIAN
jgi:hypothetical protein